jgi:hypothetical protein
LFQTGLELTIFLPPVPKGWDYRCALPYRAEVTEFLNALRNKKMNRESDFSGFSLIKNIY